MMTRREAIIFDNDTLRAAGLRHILRNVFSITAVIGATDAVDHIVDNEATLIFVTPELMAAAPDLFLPPRGRTVVITSTPSASLATIDPTQPEEAIVEALSGVIDRLTNTANQRSELSQREIDVLRLVARGYINKEIADELNISFHTVLSHRKNITSKLGIKSTSGLAVYAMMNGYITDHDLNIL